jgi:glycosyltransferase involved in cell wall biosynthesis
MRIGLIAPPWVPVPPVRYGGTEQVVDDLARALTSLGHDVRLFTIGESTCPVPQGWYFEKAVDAIGTTVPESAHVLAAYQDLADVDVIHDRGLPPVVATNHGPYTAAARLIYQETAKTASIVAISHSQRASAPEVPVAAVIHHGIDLARYAYGDGAGDYLLFVGRMSPDKGVHHAIRIARQAGRRLLVISKMWEHAERAYYEQEVRPLLGDDVELLDEMSATERIAVMRSATAVLNPICWPEPFGLVMAEALACGTPVLAFPNGAAPEIVDDGTTGFLCTDESDMVNALSRVGSIDRRACRAAAEQRFDMTRMAHDHERLYEKVVEHSQAAPEVGARSAWTAGSRTVPRGVRNLSAGRNFDR